MVYQIASNMIVNMGGDNCDFTEIELKDLSKSADVKSPVLSRKDSNPHSVVDTIDLAALKDGKRAWIVCFASFFVQVWVVGILHAFGVFFVAFLEEFKCSKAVAGTVLTRRRAHWHYHLIHIYC